MNVAHQLQEIGVFVADNGLVAVLKKMSGSLVAQIEHHCVTGQQAPHDLGQGSFFWLQQKMKMVVEQGPGVAVGFGLRQEEAEAGKEIEAILIVKENGSFLDPSDDNVLKQSGDIYAGMSGHEGNISQETENIKNVPFWVLAGGEI